MKKLFLTLIIAAVIVGAVAYAPHYLAHADKPEKADVIVLLVGLKFTPRKEEVLKLVEDGYARHIVIPAYDRVSDAGLFQNQPPSPNVKPDPSLIKGRIVKRSNYPRYYEDTHVEILEAKKMVDKSGFKSAIFVSSPYHMRRISIIAKKVFKGKGYRLVFVPSRYEPYSGSSWFLHRRELKLVTGEYSKIAWFYLYGYLS